jgi:hypothetical protein
VSRPIGRAGKSWRTERRDIGDRSAIMYHAIMSEVSARVPLALLTSADLQARAAECRRMAGTATGVSDSLNGLALRFAMLAAVREMQEQAACLP